ncbi:MAG: hypothetical protein K6E29_01055 [Cyanobacteria bacterium RUI128]|nr:hypothetical protein [Cyanobacteria bacterium RUI128]
MSTIGNYGGTITGTAVGLGIGGVGVYAGKKIMKSVVNDMAQLKGASIAEKRNFLANLGPHKGTVSKLVKESVEAFKNPKVMAKGIAKLALVGAAVGLAVDLIRRAHNKKEC